MMVNGPYKSIYIYISNNGHRFIMFMLMVSGPYKSICSTSTIVVTSTLLVMMVNNGGYSG